MTQDIEQNKVVLSQWWRFQLSYYTRERAGSPCHRLHNSLFQTVILHCNSVGQRDSQEILLNGCGGNQTEREKDFRKLDSM